MLIGIDLDNTIINYENIFYEIAKKRKITTSKKLAKNKLKKIIEKKSIKEWTNIQGKVYGDKIISAELFLGFKKFINFAKKNNIQLIIISHKTKYPIVGKKVNLHDSAIKFLKKKLDNNEFKINKNLFFEETIDDKIKRITEKDCDYFIDDLKKIFLNKNFPNTTECLLFNDKNKDLKSFINWDEIIHFFSKKIKINLNNTGKNNKSYTLKNNKIFVKCFNNIKKKKNLKMK